MILEFCLFYRSSCSHICTVRIHLPPFPQYPTNIFHPPPHHTPIMPLLSALWSKPEVQVSHFRLLCVTFSKPGSDCNGFRVNPYPQMVFERQLIQIWRKGKLYQGQGDTTHFFPRWGDMFPPQILQYCIISLLYPRTVMSDLNPELLPNRFICSQLGF